MATATVLGGPPVGQAASEPAGANGTLTTPSRDATVMELAQVIADSRAFPDCRSPAAAAVRILAGREMGIGPIAAVGGIRVSNGRVSMDAILMAGCIRRSDRYDYAIVEHSHERCRVNFEYKGKLTGDSVFTIEDAKKAGLTKNDTWQKYPRNMLFARALSNGARWYCPDIFGGAIYAHEELGIQVDEDGTVAGAGADLCTRDQRQEIVRLAGEAGRPMPEVLQDLGVRLLDELSGYEADKAIKKLGNQAAKKVATAPTPAQAATTSAQAGPRETPPTPVQAMLTDAMAEAARPSAPQQRQRILDLAERLESDETECRAMLIAVLEKRGRKKLADLNHLQAAELIERMESRLAEVASEAPFDVPPGTRQTSPAGGPRH